MSLSNATIEEQDGVINIDLAGTDLPLDMLTLTGESRDGQAYVALVAYQNDNPDGAKAIAQFEVVDGVITSVKGSVLEPARRFRVV